MMVPARLKNGYFDAYAERENRDVLIDAAVTPVTSYLQSIATNLVFEFAQHGYNHYDYA
ncbi:MAG: hypothetical protein ACXV3E_08340 [Halobacteriota archaeon]